ncbi:hypothetical protein BCR39DRAFT_555669 [Naematelia encephala]|uniref:Uncharacterized protein n=1 Tax=Naematelia encephala TaxID=71784 RepID=A0A1Y2BLA2_9TREE|nr:hypothetical protein BCR39DRAFT_555669 [Naematelia encephala]
MVSKVCKLCHGPLASPVATSAALQATASRHGQQAPVVVDCHSNCLAFSCPSCVAKDRDSYQILDLKNHIYDHHCAICMGEVINPPSRRGSSAVVGVVVGREAIYSGCI